MRVRLPLLGLLALVLLFAACSPPPNLRDETLLADNGVITTDGDCTAPCWHGITPGTTPWRDALTSLEDDPAYENVKSQQQENSKTIGAAWQPKGGTQCCQIVAEDGETVNYVFLRTKPDHTFGQVIDAHGEPTYAVGTPYADDQAIVNVIYPDIPMLVFVFVAGTTAGEINGRSEVIGVLYTTPKDMDLFLKTNSLHNWDGFGPYSDYKSDEGTEYDITPSVTITPTTTGQ